MTDPITDMLNCIRNAQAVLHQTVTVSFSNLKYEIGKILKKEGFIEKIETKGRKAKRFILLTLKYNDDKTAAIQGLKRISKPGQKIYSPATAVKPVRNGYGIAIISTSKGLMTDREARKKGVGGEIICEVW